MPKRKKTPVYWVKKETFLLIQSGQKDLLVRSEHWIYASSRVGEAVEIRANINGREHVCRRRVVARRRYATMLEIVDHEDLTRLAHGTKVQTLSYLARIYRPEQEEGPAVVFELAPVTQEEYD